MFVSGYDGLPENRQRVTHYVALLHVGFDSYSEALLEVPVLPAMSSDFDLILGTGWTKFRDATLDFNHHRVTFTDSYHRDQAIYTGTDDTSLPFVCSAKAYRGVLNTAGTQSYLLFIQAQSPDSSSPPPPHSVPIFGTDKDGAPQTFHIRLPPDLHPNAAASVTAALQHDRLFMPPHVSEIPDRDVTHDVELLPGTRPPYLRYRPTSPIEGKVLLEHLQAMIKAGVVRPSKSPYGAPVLFALKPDGSLRFCVDYRALNAVTKKDRYPLPNIEQLITKLGRSKVFSTLDMHASFWQIKLSEPEKSAFLTEHGQFEFLVMPFGMCNAPSTMQRFMHDLFADLDFVTIFIDDICIHSVDDAEHAKHLSIVLDRLHTNGLREPPQMQILHRRNQVPWTHRLSRLRQTRPGRRLCRHRSTRAKVL